MGLVFFNFISYFSLSQVLMCSCNQGGKEKNFSALSTEGKKMEANASQVSLLLFN